MSILVSAWVIGIKIILPMAGSDEAFLREGMKIKPLVEIDGKPMIEHICNMFPKGSEFIFLCRKEVLEKTNLAETLNNISTKTRIIPVEKPTRGPVETVLLADGLVGEDEEIIIHHADSLADWNFDDFLSIARKSGGCLSVFAGFNPAAFAHSLYGLIKTEHGKLKEVIEKQPFALDTKNGYTSAGSYYFSSWKIFKKYARQIIEKNMSINGIFFDSLVYNEMIKDGLDVSYYIAKNFISWGEPPNTKEYMFWSGYFEWLSGYKDTRPVYDMTDLIPAAGKGKRFSDTGYKDPKPLINVLGKPMIVKSAEALPRAMRYIFVILKEQSDSYQLDKVLKDGIENCKVIAIDKITDGMARTCLMAEHLLEKDKPLIISSCDYSFVYNEKKFQKLIEEEDPDAMIFTFREYPDARLAPNAYAYVVLEGGKIKKVSEKVPISSQPHKDHIVQGTFYFKNAGLFLWCAKEMIRKGISVNGEYYVATAINELIESGKKVMPFELDKYICWGTPQDLQTFEFWQDYFSCLPYHPYEKQS